MTSTSGATHRRQELVITYYSLRVAQHTVGKRCVDQRWLHHIPKRRISLCRFFWLREGVYSDPWPCKLWHSSRTPFNKSCSCVRACARVCTRAFQRGRIGRGGGAGGGVGVRACVRAYVYACVDACVYACARVCMRACMRACVRVCVFENRQGRSKVHSQKRRKAPIFDCSYFMITNMIQ